MQRTQMLLLVQILHVVYLIVLQMYKFHNTNYKCDSVKCLHGNMGK